MIPALLVTLALLDASFAGFRDAAGRNPLLRKRRYYVRAHLRGLLCGLGAVALIAATVVAGLALSDDPAALYASYLTAGRHMLMVYLPYAALVLLALAFYLVPRPEISSLTTVIILGPFTLLRQAVILAGATFGAITAPTPPVIASAIAAGLVMALFGPALGWLRVMPRDLERQLSIEGLDDPGPETVDQDRLPG